MSKVYAHEAVCLGATLIAQAQGDVGKARRAATYAADWLGSIDPDFKPATIADDGAVDEALALADGFRVEADALKVEAEAFRTALVAALPAALVKRANGDVVEAVRLLVDVAERLRAQAAQTPAKPAQAPAPTLTVVKAVAPTVDPATAPQSPKTVQAPSDGMVPEDDPRIPAHVKSNRALLLFQRKRLFAADQAAAEAID